MPGYNPNCIHFRRHNCNHPEKKRFLFVFAPTCNDMYNRFGCELKESYPRPDIPPPPQRRHLTETVNQIREVMTVRPDPIMPKGCHKCYYDISFAKGCPLHTDKPEQCEWYTEETPNAFHVSHTLTRMFLFKNKKNTKPTMEKFKLISEDS